MEEFISMINPWSENKEGTRWHFVELYFLHNVGTYKKFKYKQKLDLLVNLV